MFIALLLGSTQAFGVSQEECLKKVDSAKKFTGLHDDISPSEWEKELEELSKAETLCQEGKVEEGDKLLTSITTKDVYKDGWHLGQTN